MSISRRKLIGGGVAAVAGAAGLTRLADQQGLIPPDSGCLYGTGTALTYAAQRLLTRNAMAREFRRDQISKVPFANAHAKPSAEYQRLQAGGFGDWRLTVEGMVARPSAFTVADIKRFASRSQITHLACEEGWSYIAEWTGAPLSNILDQVGIDPKAKWIVYFSIEPDWWESIDMDDARHPQTLIAHTLNGADLTVDLGAPLRMRVPRQLGYKSIKFMNRIVVADNLKRFGKGLGSNEPESGYSWYGGI
jgi:DMSO/TMAO reductase YedYZ molybdopterin-dependent catalytic subunit